MTATLIGPADLLALICLAILSFWVWAIVYVVRGAIRNRNKRGKVGQFAPPPPPPGGRF